MSKKQKHGSVPLWVQLTLFYVFGALLLGSIPPFLQLARLFVAVVEAAFSLFWVTRFYKSHSGAKSRKKLNELNAALIVLSVGLTLLCLEGLLTFYPRSHSVGYTLAARNWMKKYWITNANGDRDIDTYSYGKSPQILFIGDSFTAGHGIARMEDRFSDRIRMALQGQAEVFNIGANGLNSQGELAKLARVALNPRVIVLQYFANDIEDAAISLAYPPPQHTPYYDVPRFLMPLITSSYLFNFFYWLPPKGDLSAYWNYIQKTFENKQILSAHYRDLQGFIDYAAAKNAKLLVAIFPFLSQAVNSDFCVLPIANYFKLQGVTAIDLREVIHDMNPEDLRVNSNDYHPSALVHQRVADRLVPELKLLIGDGR